MDKTVKQLTVPSAILSNLYIMYKLFVFSDVFLGILRLKYIEPLVSMTHGKIWKIEYETQKGRKFYASQFRNIITSIQDKLGCFDIVDFTYNLDSRFYIFVKPTLSNSRHSVSDKESKNIKLSGRQARNFRRTVQFRGARNDSSTKIENQNQNDNLEPSGSNENSKFKIKNNFVNSFVKGETLSPAMNIEKFSKMLNDSEELKVAKLTPIATMTQKSLESDSKIYAISRFRDEKIFQKARTYLGYLQKAEFGVISSNHDSRLTSEIYFKSEGLPIGTELHQLYVQYLIKNGFTETQINEDLVGIRSYEQTSRTMRIETVSNLIRSRYRKPGLNGGSSHISDEFPLLRPQINKVEVVVSKYSREVRLTDVAGEFDTLN